MTTPSTYYIVEIDTLVEAEHYNDPDTGGLKSYSVILVNGDGAKEVDRAYRSVKEALRQWPEAIPPTRLYISDDPERFYMELIK